MLLRATWPGNEAVPQSLLDEIIKHSIPAFKYGRSVSSSDTFVILMLLEFSDLFLLPNFVYFIVLQSTEDDPYHMTLHKLWTKMCEKDWRTVVKSLYVLHSISRDCSTDACQRFATAIKYAPFQTCYFCRLWSYCFLSYRYLGRSRLESCFSSGLSVVLISLELDTVNATLSHIPMELKSNSFHSACRSLARTRNPKNPEHKYFAVPPIGDVDALGEWRREERCREDS